MATVLSWRSEGPSVTPNVQIIQTDDFAAWVASLRDERALGRIRARIRRVELGNLGDARSVGHGVSDLRIDYGPGYRIYFARRGAAVILLLTGGDKSRQQTDIGRARALHAQWEQD